MAFIRRDLAIERSYRFNLALKLSGILLQMAVFYFVSVYVGKPEYFPFVFVGIAFSGFFQFWLNVFVENIRQEQYWGTIENIFLSPGRPLALALASVSGKLAVILVEIAVMLAAGRLFFGAGFAPVEKLAVFIPLLALNALVFGGLGLIAGSFIMYFKRGDPVNWVIGASFDLLSGVYFPVAVFPDLVKNIAEKLPTTAALDMWRGLLLDNTTPGLSQWLVQFAWALVLCGLGVLAFRTAFDRIRVKGELGSY